ncbi:MAG: DUF3426 domain-containing protein [Pseudomonadota bacterium]
MITHCPSCHTHFRVHAEQLAARAGQVRCGKCSGVFDALEHLIEEIAPARAPRPAPEFEALHVDTADAEPAQEHVIAPVADVAVETAEPAAETPEAVISESTIAEPVNVDAEAVSGASSFGFGPVAAAEPDKPARRWPWLLGALLLLLILLAQSAYHYRSAITLLFPETKPYAVALCATLGCELPLPRRIAQMSIEASDLQADTTNPNVMVLSATIKNRAIFNQQHPLLELTLTDAQDQTVVRRVLEPQDYLGKAVNTQAGFAANTEIAIKVFIEGSQVKATGYRLYLFYP